MTIPRESDSLGRTDHVPRAECKPQVAVAATFALAPLIRPLLFWMETLDTSFDIQVAPHGQVTEELRDPQGRFCRNQDGFNLLLIRAQDWMRDREAGDTARQLEQLESAAREVAAAASTLCATTPVPLLVFFCPCSSALTAFQRDRVDEVQGWLRGYLERIDGVQCFGHADLQQLYRVSDFENPAGDWAPQHMPYTAEYYAAIATLFARRMAAELAVPYKVIVVGCDDTLWKGPCGGEGASDVELAEEHLLLQELLLRQRAAGMLICLCSRNHAPDVEAVFRARPDMRLREEHIRAARINWMTTAANLSSLAQELGLSLDRLIFIDGSEASCAEVRACCPSVLTLRFPDNRQEIDRFLSHVWAFDRAASAAGAGQCAARHRRVRPRAQPLQRASSLAAFIRSIELEVEVEPMHPEHVERVAALIERSHHFNLMSGRHSLAEVRELGGSKGARAAVVLVRDRFADYGLAGAVLFRSAGDVLDVGNLVLSSRVLGRGVEHRVLAELARVGRHEGLRTASLRYRPTQRNMPARMFLVGCLGRFECDSNDRGDTAAREFSVPLEYAEHLSFDAIGVEFDGAAPSTEAAAEWSVRRPQWHDIGYRLTRPSEILMEINGQVATRTRAQ